MGELFDSPDGLRIGKFRLKDDLRLQITRQAALSRNSEFCREIRVDIRHRSDHMVRVLIFFFSCYIFLPLISLFSILSSAHKADRALPHNYFSLVASPFHDCSVTLLILLTFPAIFSDPPSSSSRP